MGRARARADGPPPGRLTPGPFDAVIVGAGHNGLTAAAYLAGSGAHPGGAVTGAPELLAARAVIEDLA